MGSSKFEDSHRRPTPEESAGKLLTPELIRRYGYLYVFPDHSIQVPKEIVFTHGQQYAFNVRLPPIFYKLDSGYSAGGSLRSMYGQAGFDSQLIPNGDGQTSTMLLSYLGPDTFVLPQNEYPLFRPNIYGAPLQGNDVVRAFNKIVAAGKRLLYQQFDEFELDDSKSPQEDERGYNHIACGISIPIVEELLFTNEPRIIKATDLTHGTDRKHTWKVLGLEPDKSDNRRKKNPHVIRIVVTGPMTNKEYALIIRQTEGSVQHKSSDASYRGSHHPIVGEYISKQDYIGTMELIVFNQIDVNSEGIIIPTQAQVNNIAQRH